VNGFEEGKEKEVLYSEVEKDELLDIPLLQEGSSFLQEYESNISEDRSLEAWKVLGTKGQRDFLEGRLRTMLQV